MPVVRVRQHVNPLSQKYQQPPDPPVWEKVYADLKQPLHLDIGCGRGQFLLSMAQQQPHWNFLGLEIREPLVIQANQGREESGLTNLHYIFCNVNNFLHPLLVSLHGVAHFFGTLTRTRCQSLVAEQLHLAEVNCHPGDRLNANWLHFLDATIFRPPALPRWFGIATLVTFLDLRFLGWLLLKFLRLKPASQV